MISTSAAPICHTTGASNVGQQMAAITTIKQGFSALRDPRLQVGHRTTPAWSPRRPTYADNRRHGERRFGNTAYGTATTHFGGQETFVAWNAMMRAVSDRCMLNPSDQGYDQGLDAKQTLGPDWQKKVDQGISNCF